ncbi:hypothetical protein Sjap_004913 [Stephania japonica]|uniref:PPPDE domain-containing protein n=1 Tax=Stephania japonica TaxID=461633 RepID=A0AAP0K436_9MAGN
MFALPRLFVASFTLVPPFFLTGSFEHIEEEGDVATAFTMARILSNIPISRGGPTSLVIYDIHALQERFYFGDHVLPCFETGFHLLKRRLHQLPDAENKVVFKTRGDLGNALAEAEEEVVNIATALGENTLSLFFKCKKCGVPVILDAGGMDGLIPVDLLTNVDIFSPNETELECLTRMPTESFEQISQTVAKILEMIPLSDSLQQDTFFWLEQEEENKRPRKRNPRFVPVNLNVYDLHPINGSIYWLGLGLYHSGIQVHGVEYEFGGHVSPSTDIFRGKPRECPGLTFR